MAWVGAAALMSSKTACIGLLFPMMFSNPNLRRSSPLSRMFSFRSRLCSSASSTRHEYGLPLPQ